MPIRSGLIALIIFASTCLGQQPPKDLATAVTCVFHEGPSGAWTEKDANEKVVVAGYSVDTKNYPGERHLLLALFKERHAGHIFDILVSRERGKRIFSIVNNASFSVAGKDVDFPEPPLGGLWTQNFLATHIRKIDRGARFQNPSESVMNVPTGVECKSYVDWDWSKMGMQEAGK